jgi:RNA polymerase sigma factor for flagellar operon FliA
MANETLHVSSEESGAAEGDGNEGQARWFRDINWSLFVVYLAAHSRRSTSKDDTDDVSDLVDSSARTPQALAICRETREKLVHLIDALPGVEANLIRLVYFEDLTLEHAGKKLGISKSWASRLHTKSLRRLGRSLRVCGLVP